MDFLKNLTDDQLRLLLKDINNELENRGPLQERESVQYNKKDSSESDISIDPRLGKVIELIKKNISCDISLNNEISMRAKVSGKVSYDMHLFENSNHNVDIECRNIDYEDVDIYIECSPSILKDSLKEYISDSLELYISSFEIDVNTMLDRKRNLMYECGLVNLLRDLGSDYNMTPDDVINSAYEFIEKGY